MNDSQFASSMREAIEESISNPFHFGEISLGGQQSPMTMLSQIANALPTTFTDEPEFETLHIADRVCTIGPYQIALQGGDSKLLLTGETAPEAAYFDGYLIHSRSEGKVKITSRIRGFISSSQSTIQVSSSFSRLLEPVNTVVESSRSLTFAFLRSLLMESSAGDTSCISAPQEMVERLSNEIAEIFDPPEGVVLWIKDIAANQSDHEVIARALLSVCNVYLVDEISWPSHWSTEDKEIDIVLTFGGEPSKTQKFSLKDGLIAPFRAARFAKRSLSRFSTDWQIFMADFQNNRLAQKVTTSSRIKNLEVQLNGARREIEKFENQDSEYWSEFTKSADLERTLRLEIGQKDKLISRLRLKLEGVARASFDIGADWSMDLSNDPSSGFDQLSHNTGGAIKFSEKALESWNSFRKQQKNPKTVLKMTESLIGLAKFAQYYQTLEGTLGDAIIAEARKEPFFLDYVANDQKRAGEFVRFDGEELSLEQHVRPILNNEDFCRIYFGIDKQRSWTIVVGHVGDHR